MSRRWIGILLLLIVLAAAIPLAQLGLFAITAKTPGSQDTQAVEIRKGQSPNEITKSLLNLGVLSGGRDFIWLGKLGRRWKKIKAGEYAVSAAMTPLEIFQSITSGVSIAHPITVREGENMYEIAADLEAKGLAAKDQVLELMRKKKFISTLGLDETPPSLEGFLFPDTYYFNKTLSAEDMLREMTHHFKEVWKPEYTQRAQTLGMTQFQVVTLASIIEKETGAPQDRPLIASVFHNRLRKHMKLQSDPTTIYGMWDRYTGKIHRTDLQTKDDYNTYQIPALPLGPISNPGTEAVHAALYPATSDFLFFVSHNDGTTEFTRSLTDHNAAVKKFQLDPKAHEGKSWRDLSKAVKDAGT